VNPTACPANRCVWRDREGVRGAAAAKSRAEKKSKFTRQINGESAVQPSRQKYSSSVFQQSVVHSRRPALI
jgi:hypothetical protein